MLNISISDTVYLISQVRTTGSPASCFIARVLSTVIHSDPDEMNFD
jgi:hypothetical protein